MRTTACDSITDTATMGRAAAHSPWWLDLPGKSRRHAVRLPRPKCVAYNQVRGVSELHHLLHVLGREAAANQGTDVSVARQQHKYRIFDAKVWTCAKFR
jgi:hypothetical protein